MNPRVLVCGGRGFSDFGRLSDRLDKMCLDRNWTTEPDEYGNWLPAIHVIHGGAQGADGLADRYAIVNCCALTVFEADWERYGKKAGPLRNQRMIDEGKPDLIVAFPGGRGTADMVRRARQHGIEVQQF